MMNALLKPLLKYWYLVLGLTVIAAALAGWPREQSYESRARLLFKLGDEFLQDNVDPNARSNSRILLAEAMNTDVQILTSYDQYLKVVEELGVESFAAPEHDGPPLELAGAVERLRQGLNVKSVENSAVIHLTYEHTDPARAKLVLATLIDVYFRERSSVLGGLGAGALTAVREDTLERFVSAREAYDRFLEEGSLQDVESTLVILREQLMGLTAAARDSRRERIEHERQLAAIDTEIDSQPERTELFSEPRVNTALERARNRLVELRVEEQQLLGKYLETSRPVTRVRAEMTELLRIIDDEQNVSDRAVLRTGNNPVRDSLSMQRAELKVSLAGAEARIETLAEQEATLRAELRDLERRYVRADKLDDELTVAEARFRDVDDQVLASRILADSKAARAANVRVIERPALPGAAAGMPAPVRLGFGALIGFLAGWILAVWIELLGRPSGRATGVPERRAEELAYARYALAANAAAGGGPEGARRALPVLGEFRSVPGERT